MVGVAVDQRAVEIEEKADFTPTFSRITSAPICQGVFLQNRFAKKE